MKNGKDDDKNYFDFLKEDEIEIEEIITEENLSSKNNQKIMKTTKKIVAEIISSPITPIKKMNSKKTPSTPTPSTPTTTNTTKNNKQIKQSSTASTPDKTNKTHHIEYEFGGPIGAFGVIVGLPLVMFTLYFLSNKNILLENPWTFDWQLWIAERYAYIGYGIFMFILRYLYVNLCVGQYYFLSMKTMLQK